MGIREKSLFSTWERFFFLQKVKSSGSGLGPNFSKDFRKFRDQDYQIKRSSLHHFFDFLVPTKGEKHNLSLTVELILHFLSIKTLW